MVTMVTMGGLEIIIIVLIMMRIGVDNGGEIGWIGRGRRKLLRSPTGFQPNRCELGPSWVPPLHWELLSSGYHHHRPEYIQWTTYTTTTTITTTTK